MADFDDHLEQIKAFPLLVKNTILEAEGDTLVDVLGAVNSTQTQIGKIKLGAASEVETETSGNEWRYEQSRKGIRSYNNSGMFRSLMPQLAIESFVELLQFLMKKDVLRIQWQWSNLEKMLHDYDIFLRVAPHEIEEGEPDFDMGEYWVAGATTYKRVEEKMDG